MVMKKYCLKSPRTMFQISSILSSLNSYRMFKAVLITIIRLYEMALGRTVKRCQELRRVEDHPRGVRAKSVNTRVKKVRLMRKMASGLNISPISMRRIGKHELESIVTKKTRKPPSIVRQGRASNVLFTDQYISTVNYQNNGQVLQRGHQRSEKVGIAALRKTPLVFVEKNVKIYAKYYQDNSIEGSGVYIRSKSQNNCLAVSASVSILFGKRHLAIKFTYYESDGHRNMVNLGK
uniref:Transposase n=1 Tax=Heterorhabditis bacteriophora TaxID=37862 RepID=A0A1I7WSY1_HETBA